MRPAPALLALAVTVAGCGGGADADPPLADGRHFAYIRALDASTARVDPAEFLTGEAANEAAVADGAIESGETVPNDYYIRNDDTTTVELELADDVRVTAVRCPDACRDGVRGDLDQLVASFERGGDRSLSDPYRGPDSQYWVTVAAGRVTAIDEQYLP